MSKMKVLAHPLKVKWQRVIQLILLYNNNNNINMAKPLRKLTLEKKPEEVDDDMKLKK